MVYVTVMSFVIKDINYFTVKEVADLAKKSKQTIVRWYKSGKIPEPSRLESNGWRVYPEDQKDIIVNFATGVKKPPKQGKLL